jgi:L-serine dehydratase
MEESRPASILNDVLGPVMTGPSSSHTAGPARLGRMVSDLCGGVRQADIYFSKSGSYAATMEGQASNRGFTAGLLGWDCADPRLPGALEYADRAGIPICFHGVDESYDHPNRAVIVCRGPDDITITVNTISIGGGNVRITDINKTPVWLDGSRDEHIIIDETVRIVPAAVQGQSRLVRAVVPASRDSTRRPGFINSQQLESQISDKMTLSDAGLLYEESITGWQEGKILSTMSDLLRVMEQAAGAGVKISTNQHFRVLKPTASDLEQNRASFIDSGILSDGIIIATATMELNRNMGVIVAAPTAGSAGVIPAVLLPLLRQGHNKPGSLERALLAGGLVGAFIFNQATFAAEEAGCQAENGAASAMAAAALVEWSGGNAQTGLRAAALALSNLLGLVCDPVAASVEIPCISRNVMAAANAVISANMVLGGFDPFIPFDEVIMAMMDIGRAMPAELRCTAQGGLAATPTARRIPPDSIKVR